MWSLLNCPLVHGTEHFVSLLKSEVVSFNENKLLKGKHFCCQPNTAAPAFTTNRIFADSLEKETYIHFLNTKKTSDN